MALNLNKVILAGRLTAAPELKQTPNGISVLAFSLAVDRRFVKQGEERQTDFIDCVAWRQTAEFISRYFGKGDPLCITGTLQKRSYDAKDGTKRYVTEVIADEANFVESKSSKNSTPSNNYGSDPGAPATTVLNDDPEVLSDDGVPF